MSVVEPDTADCGCVPWDIDTSCCENWDGLTPEVQCRSEQLAWATIDTLTAGRVGRCPVLMRPCLQPPCDWCSGPWMTPMIVNGRWVNNACGMPECSCARLCEIVTPGPVAELLSVSFGGEPVDLDQFRVDNGNRIVRQDGMCWPSCQDMTKPLSAPSTLGVTYIPGVKPGPAGELAAGVLACEFSKACAGSKCRLPSSVTAIARQGVTFTMSAGMFPDGLTGIREVDAFLTAVNPNALRVPPMVWSPDLAATRHRFTTWTPT